MAQLEGLESLGGLRRPVSLEQLGGLEGFGCIDCLEFE